MPPTVSEVIETKLQKKVDEKKGELAGIVVLDIDGPEGGKWTIDCAGGTIKKEEAASPDVRIRMNDEDFKSMIEGGLNPVTAMFSGKLKIEGDMALASKLAMAIR